MSWGGDTPMHTNSLTPMQISETQRSFLNFRIDSSYYGTVAKEVMPAFRGAKVAAAAE
jgi:hypothetical protein